MAELNTEEKLAHESALLSTGVKSWWVLKVLAPFETLFRKAGLQPDHITYLATLSAFPCAYLLIHNDFLMAGWVTLLIGSLDILDGKLARALDMDSKRGEFLDSVLDRLQDFIILVGLLVYFQDTWVFWVVLINLATSQLISYVKAKGELLGVDLKRVGIMQRPERFFTLSVGLLFDGAFEVARMHLSVFDPLPSHVIMKAVIVFLAIMSGWTVWQRSMSSIEQLKG